MRRPMNTTHNQDHLDSIFLYALRALPSAEVRVVEAQLSVCTDCRQELEALRPVVGFFVSWPTDVLRPPACLWERLAHRIAEESGSEPMSAAPQRRVEAEWEEVAPRISCKVLATDTEKKRVSMLVRLARGPISAPPPCRHRRVACFTVSSWSTRKKLYPGDYMREEAGSADHRVWSDPVARAFCLRRSKTLISDAERD